MSIAIHRENIAVEENITDTILNFAVDSIEIGEKTKGVDAIETGITLVMGMMIMIFMLRWGMILEMGILKLA